MQFALIQVLIVNKGSDWMWISTPLTPIYYHAHYGYISSIEQFHKFHNALHKYPTMQHFITEMCTHVHISITKWCIVGYGTKSLWDMGLSHCGIWDWCIVRLWIRFIAFLALTNLALCCRYSAWHITPLKTANYHIKRVKTRSMENRVHRCLTYMKHYWKCKNKASNK